jgi:DNA polymerase-1
VEAWYAEHIGKGKAIENLDKVPPEQRIKYCAQDVVATYNLYRAQQKGLDQFELNVINETECALIPMLLDMKKLGIRINGKERDRLAEVYSKEVKEGKEQLLNQFGLANISSPKQKAEMFHNLGIHSTQTTDTGNESFAKEFLQECGHSVAKLLLDVTRKNSMVTKYLAGGLKKCEHNGRIHTTFLPTQRDDGGTVTGRFAAQSPNLQNISAKAETGGEAIRGLFLPEEGHRLVSFDYKQIEYVLFSHYAVGPGAEELRENIRKGKDYHEVAQNLLAWYDAGGRKLAKTFNFGVLYGLSLNGFRKRYRGVFQSAADAAGLSFDDYSAKVYNDYFASLPFVRPTCESIKAVAKQRGYVRSIGGRLHHVPPDGGLYKVVNYLVQGSAADYIKIGMRRAWDAGVFSVLKPHLTIHDELLFSMPLTREGIQAADALEEAMLPDMGLRVPLRLDKESGDTWGTVSAETWEADYKRLSA